MSYETHLWQQIAQAAENVTDAATGRFENKHLVDEIATVLHSEQLPPEVRDVSVDMQAKTLAGRFIAKRNPKPTKQGILFHPDSVLPLGNGARVWMEHATAADLMTWGRLSAKNLQKVAKAESARQEYVASRIGMMHERPDQTLGQIERAVCGYVEDVNCVGPDDEDDEDDAW